MPNILAAVAMGAITIYGFLYSTLLYTQDANEPPLVTTAFPFIGSMIGLARKKSKYYVELKYAMQIPSCRSGIQRISMVIDTSIGRSTTYPSTRFVCLAPGYTS
jgi:hypothetical protein